MSVLHSHTTADYIEWDTMLTLIRKLYDDKKIRLSLLIGCGCFLGLRISDLLNLKWEQLLDCEIVVFNEKKTMKAKRIAINNGFRQHIIDCYTALDIKENSQFCFLNKYGKVISIQMINRQLKNINSMYGLNIQNLSSHSLRKTFGRRIIENAGNNPEMALIKLCEYFNHASPEITWQYLGLPAEDYAILFKELSYSSPK